MRQTLGRKQSFASVIILLVMMLCGQSASAKLGYTPLRGTMGYEGGYDYDKMFDGEMNTKWCSASNHEGWDNGWWVIFKTSKAFSPTSYQIITADDTNSHSERNWKTWKIFGANFDSDDDALKEASEWVLLDEKQDIGLDVIPDISYNKITFEMSEANTENFKYFMIYITEIGFEDPNGAFDPSGGGLKQQMAEFSFVETTEPTDELTFSALDGTKSAWGNEYSFASLVDGNDYSKWCSADSHEGYDNGWWIVFKASYAITPYSYTLKTSDDTGKFSGRNWKSWKIYAANFDSDEEAAKNADGWVLIDEKKNYGAEIPAANYASASFSFNKVVTEAYNYFKIEVSEIMGGNTMQMSEFKIYEKETYSALDGTKSAWGDAYSYASLFDGNDHSKWCSADTHEGYDNGWWVVFKTSEPIMPAFYKLTTCDDSNQHFARNWKSWNIYAANFDSDVDAAKDAEGWVLIDEKQDIGLDQIPAANFATSKFKFSNEVTEAYSYFKIEIPEIMGGNTMQMSEFTFGSSLEDFEEVNIGTYGYATLFRSKEDAMIPEGVQAFTGVIDGSSLILTEVTGQIPAGTAVILKGTEGTYKFTYTTDAPSVGENDLKGSAEPIEADGNQYVLAQKDGVIGFYKAEGTIPAGKAYLIGAAGVKGYVFDAETGIESLTPTLSEGEGAIYDLSGRRVEKMQKGVYIVNGKKILR